MFKKVISIVLSFSLLLGQGVPYVLAQEVTPTPTPEAVTSTDQTANTQVTDNDNNNAAVTDNQNVDSNSGNNTVVESPTPTPTLTPEETVTPSDSPSPTPVATPVPCPSSDPSATPSDGTTVAVDNSNCAQVADTTTSGSNSGLNTASGSDGNVTTTTGDATGSATADNTGNTNTTDVASGSAVASAGDGTASGDSASSAPNFDQAQTSGSTAVQNDNAATVDESLDVGGNSGVNTSSNNDGNVTVKTGDVELTARLINILNLNVTGDNFVNLIVNIYGDITGNFDLSAFSQSVGIPEDQVMAVASNNGTASASDQLNIDNTNGAQVDNNLTVSGTSGQNTADNNDGNVTIITGRVKILISLLNFINANFSGSNWYFAMINIFSDVHGDINMPDAEKYLYAYIPTVDAQATNTNPGEGSTNVATASASSTTTVDNTNDANLTNNVAVTGDSGNNQSVGNDGKTKLDTGTVDAVVSLINWVNTNLTGNNWVVLVVNVLGKWVGNLVAFPGVGLFTPADGSGVYAFLAKGQARTVDGVTATANNSNTGEDSTNTALASANSDTSVANDNTANVVNNVDVDGVSGQNQANGNDGNVRIVTGDVSILAGILNIINTNATGRNWMLIFVNIFGTLNGNLVFPCPDLTISISDGVNDISPGATLNYQVTVTNQKNGMARNVKVTSDIPGGSGSTLLSASDSGYQTGGKVQWDLGDMNPGESRTLTYSVAVDPSIKSGALTTTANTSTDTTECDLTNNSASITNNVYEGGMGGGEPGPSGSTSPAGSSPSDGGIGGGQVLGLSATTGITDNFLYHTESVPVKPFDYSYIFAVLFILAAGITLTYGKVENY
jgi:hypothetical protein